MVITKKKHEAINTLFNTNQSPREQLQQILDMSSPILRKERRAEMQLLLDTPDEQMYIDRLLKFKPKKKK